MARIQQTVANFSAANQVGPWLKHDFYEAPFCLSFMVTPAGFAGTLGIDYVVDDFMNDGERPVTFSQSGTTITINDTGITQPSVFGGGLTHGLAAGDWIQFRGSPGGTVDGGYAVATIVSPTQYTITSSVTQTVALRGAFVISARVVQASATDKIVPFAPASARATVGVAFPIVASRLRASTFTTAGFGVLLSVQGGNLGGRM